jgi:hypothetical protein
LQPLPEEVVAVALAIQAPPLAAVLQGPTAKLHQATMLDKTEPTNPATAAEVVVVVVAGAVAKAEPHPEEIKVAMLDRMD